MNKKARHASARSNKMLAPNKTRSDRDAGPNRPDVATSLITLQRFGKLSPVFKHVCLMLAEGAQSHDIAARLGITHARLQTLRSMLLRKMGAESQIDLALRIGRLERSRLSRATERGKPTSPKISDPLMILSIDREEGRADELRSAIRQLGHVVRNAKNEDEARLCLSEQRFDLCMVAHGTRGDLIQLLRTSVPLKDRPIIVQYSPREGRELKLRHCGDIISADIPRNFNAFDLKCLFDYCTFEDISIQTDHTSNAHAALC